MNSGLRTATAIILALSIAACGGRASNPVMVQQYGDQKKSCAALEAEMVGIQQEIAHLLPETQKTGKNVALGVAGAFLLVPWFFMDLSHAEQEEVNAYRQRYNNLAIIATDKKCDINTTPMPPLKPQESEEKSSEFPTGKNR